MTGWLRLLAACLPLQVHISGPLFVWNYTETINNEVDEDCGCDDLDPDQPHPTLVLLPIDAAADLFAEAIRRSDNGALADDVAWDMARSLELGGDVA